MMRRAVREKLRRETGIAPAPTTTTMGAHRKEAAIIEEALQLQRQEEMDAIAQRDAHLLQQ